MAAFRDYLAILAAQKLKNWVSRYVESQTLQRSMHVELTENEGHAIITVPQYWAVYYHDGRGPVRPINGKFLVWFQNIEDDPRVATGYPTRASEIRPLALSPEEFRELAESGKMIVRRSAGPAAGKPFFTRLEGRAQALVTAELKREFSRYVKAELGGLLKIRATTRIR